MAPCAPWLGCCHAATIALAHKLGLALVAEGVESEAQANFLIAQGCDVLQGFRYGEPAPAATWETGWLLRLDTELVEVR